MRVRALLPYLLLPPLLGVLITSAFVARSVAREREDAADVSRVSLSGDLVNDANAWIASEITNLLALGAFTDVPGSLRDYGPAVDSLKRNASPDAIFSALESSDARGSELLASIDALGRAPDAVHAVLAPLAPEVKTALADGDRAFIDPEPYAEAATWARDQWAAGQGRVSDAQAAALSLDDEPPYWRDSTFIGFTLALALLAAAGTLLAVWRVGAMMSSVTYQLSREHERVEALQERSVRLQHLISFGRRLSSEVDSASLSRTLVAETRRVIGGDVVALVHRTDTTVEPTAVDGALGVSVVSIGEGVVGRCIDSGAPARTLVPTDPFIPGGAAPLSLLVAPLVADGRVTGALVVAAVSESLFDETDEMALHVLVLLAGGALTAAERLDSTRALTLRDPLTGLANRRKLDQDLESVASADGAAFLMVDIDHFKAFNDVHGHRRGDELLRVVAGAIASAVREEDVVYRYGGEEFSVLLAGADVVEAGVIAERVRAAVRTATTSDGVGPVTVSVGVAAQGAPIVATTLVEHADAALYAAKEAGRDRVLVRRTLAAG